MPPKTPSELREQIERANEEPARPGYTRTAEGLEIPEPKRDELFGALEEVSEPEQK
jgi:hypothetical protein